MVNARESNRARLPGRSSLNAAVAMDAVIETIRASASTDEARESLIEKFALSEIQAQAILDMRLGRLTGLEREKLEAEYKELWQLTDYLEGLLADEKKLMGAIIDELKQIRADYADERRTKIVDAEGEILTEELKTPGSWEHIVNQIGMFRYVVRM